MKFNRELFIMYFIIYYYVLAFILSCKKGRLVNCDVTAQSRMVVNYEIENILSSRFLIKVTKVINIKTINPEISINLIYFKRIKYYWEYLNAYVSFKIYFCYIFSYIMRVTHYYFTLFRYIYREIDIILLYNYVIL